MQFDAFICYSSEDRKVANAVREQLEAQGIRCWIAPRNVMPGSSWSSSIVTAIESSAVAVVIFSAHANKSPQVLREIERAVHKERPIIPFRIEEVVPSKDLEYFISSCHWLNAMSPPLEAHIAGLAESIRALSNREAEETGPGERKATEEAETKAPGGGKGARQWAVAAACALVLAAGGALGIHHFSKRKPQAGGTGELKPTVELKEPAAGASLTSSFLLSWSSDKLEARNLSFDLSVQSAGKEPILKQRIGRNSIGPTDLADQEKLEGAIKWKVRPVWVQPGGEEKEGAWSEERTFTYFANSLHRILATHTLVVGIAEADGIFIIKDGGVLSGIEIDMLREIFSQILRDHQVSAGLVIESQEEIWGEKYFRMLDNQGSVDLLASGISIMPERQRDYAINFTDPTFEYPQSLVTKTGVQGFAEGRFTVEQLGVAEKTTNESFARKLLGGEAAQRLKAYQSPGAYDKMLNDLVAGKIDGALMDKPYALQKINARKKHDAENGVELATLDITPLVPGTAMEKIGFAVRKSDPKLLQEINARLSTIEAKRRALAEKYLPGWGK